MQLGPQDAVDWRQHDAADEAAQDLGGFGHGFGRVERLGEAPDLATIELGEVGMEPQHRRGLAGANAPLRLRLFLLKRGKTGLQSGGVAAILNGAHDGGELALDLGECPLGGKGLALGRGGETAHLCVECVDEGGDQIGRHHSLLEPAQDAVFEVVAAYQQHVRAGAL
ncbi:MAG: hypothetical protein WBF03_21115 [Xanthobacteraceae bacterium]